MKYAKHGVIVGFIVGALGIFCTIKVPATFGKTHFIVGYSAPAQQPVPAKTMGQTTTGGVHCVLFAPDDDVQAMLVSLITNETFSISVAIFMLTTKEITEALIAAHKRGVSVEIITDTACVRERWSKVHRLTDAGVAVYEYKPPRSENRMNNIMHHKFVIFGANQEHKALVWTGSFNFTRSAQLNNQENAVILNDADAIEKFTKQFELLKKRSKRL